MSTIRLLGTILKNKLSQPVTVTKHHNPNVPLKLWEGSIVDIDITTKILAESAGSNIPNIKNSLSVIAVGEFIIHGVKSFRSYLSDERSFIQTTPTKNGVECRLYTLERDEQYADENNTWEFLLDKEEGVLGWPLFEVYKPDGTPVQYARMWTPSDKRIDPPCVTEIISDETGKRHTSSHYIMQYGRQLSDTINEYLIPEITDETALNLWIGIDVLPEMITVIPA